MNFSPRLRLVLTLLAAALAGVVGVVDQPALASGIESLLITLLAGVGIVPPVKSNG